MCERRSLVSFLLRGPLQRLPWSPAAVAMEHVEKPELRVENTEKQTCGGATGPPEGSCIISVSARVLLSHLFSARLQPCSLLILWSRQFN